VIGDNTHISRNLVLYTTNHDHKGERLPYDDHQVERPVTIGRNVWIGMNVCITPGSTIGDGAIVGLGAVIHGTVPPLAIVGAAPWVQIGSRDAERYEALDRAGSYGGPGGRRISD
jgi:maltose O-acetyltransferase